MALNIADLFEHAVDAVPDRLAVRVGDDAITFAELEHKSNQLAHYLAAQGIGVGDHVGLYAKNSIEHVIGLIAILKVRAVSINVNYRYVAGERSEEHTSELQSLMRISYAVICLTQKLHKAIRLPTSCTH